MEKMTDDEKNIIKIASRNAGFKWHKLKFRVKKSFIDNAKKVAAIRKAYGEGA